MSEPIEMLEGLISDRKKSIKGHEDTIAFEQGAIERDKGEIRGLEIALRLFKKTEPDAANGTPALIGKYSAMGLTEAIEDAVNTRGTAPGLTARELVDALESEGFKTKSKDLYNSAYPVAMGLVEQGRIASGIKNGKRSFVKIK